MHGKTEGSIVTVVIPGSEVQIKAKLISARRSGIEVELVTAGPGMKAGTRYIIGQQDLVK